MKIIAGTYGAGDCQLDVTDRLQEMVKNGRLDINVTNDLLTDPCPNRKKTLRFRFRLKGSTEEHSREVVEGEIVSEPSAELTTPHRIDEAERAVLDDPVPETGMKVIEAIWGAGDCQKDVTERVQSLVSGGRLIFTASTETLSEPCVNRIKSLKLTYRLAGSETEYSKDVREGDLVVEPVTGTKSAGIFYTNLSVHRKYLDRVLAQLAKSSDRVDIITCPWKPIKGNPFPEIPWQYHISRHLTINLQILKLLYIAREADRYEYVFFLEHDVLYPEGYFDIEPFDTDVLSNTNYIGLSEEGFQLKHPAHEPLHQLAMRLPAAIEHFESTLSKAMIHGSIVLEPNGRSWQKRQSSVPAVHINHGKHFTSHFSIYSDKVVAKSHPYWGMASYWWD